jgi:hypothetical protein
MLARDSFRRRDNKTFEVVETAISLWDNQNAPAALAHLTENNVPLDVARRVLHEPDKRRGRMH